MVLYCIILYYIVCIIIPIRLRYLMEVKTSKQYGLWCTQDNMKIILFSQFFFFLPE